MARTLEKLFSSAMAASAGQPLYRLNNGVVVLAKPDGEWPVQYANRTQAYKRAAALGTGWTVYQFGRPFYVGPEDQSSYKS